jgi:hypothetical protein
VRGLGLPWLRRRRAGRVAAAIAVPALATLGLAAPAAAATTTFCVGVQATGCTMRATAADAFADAVDGDTILLGPMTVTTPLDDSGRKLTIGGAGAGATVLAGGLTLASQDSLVGGATIGDLDLAGVARVVTVTGMAVLHGDAALQAAQVRGDGGVQAADGAPLVDSVALDLGGGPGLSVACDARLNARGITLVGAPAATVTTECAGSEAVVRDSILWPNVAPADAPLLVGPGKLTTARTDLRAVTGRADGPGDLHITPLFGPGLRLAPGSPLIDAGGTDGVLADAWPEDLGQLPRIADGDGDGVAARDLGAYESLRRLPPVPDNLLANPGAETLEGWDRSPDFAFARYGVFAFPTAATGAALGAGATFFAGGKGSGSASSATQRVDLVRFAPEIDLQQATARLSGLLGGYRLSPDAGTLEAIFLAAGDRPLGSFAIATPTPYERRGTITLLPRSAAYPIPRLTRAIRVTMRAHGSPGDFIDAYFDNLALTVIAPKIPPPPPPPPRLKPFAGPAVLNRVAVLSRHRRTRFRLACLRATVGRCSGAVTLMAAVKKGGPAVYAGSTAVSIAAGTTRWVALRPGGGVRRAIRQRKRVQARLFLSFRDGQGVVSAETARVVLKPRGRRR